MNNMNNKPALRTEDLTKEDGESHFAGSNPQEVKIFYTTGISVLLTGAHSCAYRAGNVLEGFKRTLSSSNFRGMNNELI